MLLQGCAEKAPQYQEMILVFSGVLDGNILEQTKVCPNNVFHLGLQLLPVAEYAIYLTVSCPRKLAQENCHQVLL